MVWHTIRLWEHAKWYILSMRETLGTYVEDVLYRSYSNYLGT